MAPLIVTLFLSLVLSLLLTHLLRLAASRRNLVDRPDGGRFDIRRKPGSAVGGMAVLLSVTAALLFVWLLAEPGSSPLGGEEEQRGLVVLLLAGTAICFLGVVDDFGRLGGRHKLLGQVLVASAVTLSEFQAGRGISSVHLFGGNILLGWTSFPFTVFLLLGAINSLNLLGGVDGLLGTVGVIMCLTLAAMAWLTGSLPTVCVSLALAGALLGFLPYNFPPAPVHLGGGGSMLIGLAVGVLAIRCSLKTPATVALAAPLCVWTVPLYAAAIPLFRAAVAALLRELFEPGTDPTDGGPDARRPFPPSKGVYRGERLWDFLTKRDLRQRGRGFQAWGPPSPWFKPGLDVRWPGGASRTLLLVSALCLVAAGGALASLFFHNDLLALVSAGGVVAVLVAERCYLP
jgi:UDP-GlcNAc:undecaprenyl-phosphate GlcNAc-1-phosphate transferase